MKKQIEVKVSPELEAEALQVLRDVPDLEVTVEPPGGAIGLGADAVVRYQNYATPIAIQVKSRVSSAQAHQYVSRADALGERPILVVAGTTTSSARKILASGGVGYIDGTGNVELELPGLLLRISGSGHAPTSKPPTRLSGKSSLVVQALLLEPNRDWHVGDLAERSGVSGGLVHRVVSRLEDEGVVGSMGSGPTRTRRVVNPTALLDLWAEEHLDQVSRERAYLLTQTVGGVAPTVAAALDQARIDYALTGAAAASLVAPFVTSIAVTEFWISSKASMDAVIEATACSVVSQGANVAFLQAKDDGPMAYRQQRSEIWMTNIFRLYLDLRHDPRRGIEQSDNLRREVIGF